MVSDHLAMKIIGRSFSFSFFQGKSLHGGKQEEIAGRNHVFLAKIDCHTKVVAEAANHKMRLANCKLDDLRRPYLFTIVRGRLTLYRGGRG